MKNIKYFLVICSLVLLHSSLLAQTEPSAIMNIESTGKGILIPRMTSAQRNIISNPATGLLVFDISTNSFWFYNGSSWGDLSSGNQSSASDSPWKKNGTSTYYTDGNVGIGVSNPNVRLNVADGTEVNGTNGGFLMLGHLNGQNLGIDNNEIQARNNGQPAALHLNLDGGTISLNRDGGNVGIGTTSPQALLHLSSTNTPTAFRVGSVGDIVFDKPNVVGGRFIVKENGNIGIGTTNPTQKLQVEDGNVVINKGIFTVQSTGDATGSVSLTGPTGVPGIIFRSNKPESYRYDIRATNNGIQFATHAATTIPPVRFIIGNDGKIGIGTTPVGGFLDIRGIANFAGHVGLHLRSGNSHANFESSQIAFGYNNRTDYRHAIKTRHHGGSKLGNAIDFYVWNYGVDNLGDVGTKHVMSLNGGNVGIGTTSPVEELDIYGKSNPAISLKSDNGNMRLGVATCNGCFSSTAKIGDVVMRAENNGSNFILAARSNGNIIFTTGLSGESKKMEVMNDGKVVIGSTPTPEGYRLYVKDGILSERVRVALETSSRWADDAFDKTPTLKKMEKHIKRKSHLIGVPSADKLVKEGIDVAEMDATLLRQIEWLWMSLIEKDKESKQQAKKIKSLEKRLEKLEKAIMK